MALTKRFIATKSKNVRWNPSSSLKEGCDRDQHLLVGTTSSPPNSLAHRAMVEFDHDWSGIGSIVKVELFIKTETSSTHYTYGTAPRVRVNRATEEFSSVSSSEDTWTAAMYESISSWGGVDVEADIPLTTAGTPQDEYWLSLDITRLMEYFVPTSVLINGHAGGGGDNNGFVLLAPGNEDITKQRSIFKSRYTPSSSDYPYVQVTYDPPNQPPLAPTLTGPPQGHNDTSQFFEGDHHDPDGDPMGGRYIDVFLRGGSSPIWSLTGTLVNAGSEEAQTGHFSVPLSLAAGVLKLQTDYEWTAATKDVFGRVGPYQPTRRSLRIDSSVPTFTLREWDTISAAELPMVEFGGWAVDPDNDKITYFQLQMQPQTAHSDGSWVDPDRMVWDTGEIPTTTQEQNQPEVSKKIVRQYAGSPLDPGFFSWRMRCKDATGAYSPWVYDDFELTGTPDIEPGQGDNPGTIVDRPTPTRIGLYLPGTGRAPGALIGYVDDPIHLGASAFLNGAGEMYFSLPALHPYVPSIEPYRVHYQVQQYVGDRYMPKFAGLITDFDADENSIVFYGTDYMGLLQTAVDERYTGTADDQASEKPASGTGGGGSKYTDKTIDYVIKDQLLYHKGLANSPVGFISVGAMSALAEHVTIYSTYSEALPFITGLIDSHKQGTGREARFYARPKDSTWMTWEWALTDPWGIDRPAIELEYGGLINGFRIVAFGDFGTRVLGIGSKRGEVRVYRANGASGLDEAQWGRRARVVYHADIVDQNDLQRRVNEQATALAKVGKRVAIAIKADSLAPFDGWDLGDNIKVNIVRGAVDTSRYGSQGYWTVYGVEWRWEPDGHSDITLTLMPKKTATPPNADLIPSIDPGISREWQVGYGVPHTYGEPPIRTPGAGTFAEEAMVTPLDAPEELPLSTDPVTAKHYEDLNTGCVYELNEATGNYEQVYCPPGDGDLLPAVDTVPPAPPVIKSLVTSSVQQQDGTSLVSINATVGYTAPPADLNDLNTYVLEVTRAEASPGVPNWTLATTWIGPAADRIGAVNTVITVVGLPPATTHWLRAYATDRTGNRSVPSATSSVVSAFDNLGPPVPSGVVMEAGHSTIGLRWTPSTALDFAYTEVQWRIVSPPGNWTSIHVAGTMTVITGLTNDTAYEVRLRTVDTSGNVLRATGGVDGSGNPIYETVKVASDPNAGWVSAGSITPTALPGNSLVWDDAMIGQVFAGRISADWIVAGTLRVGAGSGRAAAIEVYDSSGRLIGRWSTDGIEVLDPANPGYRLIIDEATLTVWSGWDTAQPYRAVSLTPLGVDAASITFGSARGGHNLIQNSSFELGRFGVAATSYNIWDIAADWNATRVTDVNITTGADRLVMTTVT